MTRKPLREATLFCLGLFLVLELMTQSLDYLVRHVKGTDAGKISQVMLHAVDADVVVFGASNAETGVSPLALGSSLGRSVYNLAVDGTSIEQYSALIREYLVYGRKGSLVVVVLSGFALESHERIGPTAPGAYYAHIRDPFIYEAMSRFDAADAARARYVPFYRYVLNDQSYYKAAVQAVRERASGHAAAQSDESLGFIPHYTHWGDQHDLHGGSVKCKIDDNVVAIYRSLVAEINQSGRRAVLVLPPVHAAGLPLLDGLPAMLPIFASLATAGNHYLDYHRHAMSVNNRYFYNYTHLNAEGAKFFSSLLGNDLRPIVNGESPWPHHKELP